MPDISPDFQLQALREAVRDELSHGLMTPEPFAELSERVREVARDEAEAVCNGHQVSCVIEGPVFGLRKEMDKMRDTMVEIQRITAEERGAAKGAMAAQARTALILQMVVGAVSVVSTIIGLLWRARHGW